MRSRYRFHEPDAAHFITSTIVDWLPVFTTPACCEILIRALDYCRDHKQLQLHAWVIMENHFHAVVSGPSQSNIIADWKKFTARELVHQIDLEKRHWLLTQLHHEKLPHKTRSQHQVWQEGVHPQAISSDEMMLQNRAERDRQAAGLPEGCRRRAASTSITSTITPCVAVG